MNRIFKFSFQSSLILALVFVGHLNAQDLGGLPGGDPGGAIDPDALSDSIFDAVDQGGGPATPTGGGGGTGGDSAGTDNSTFDVQIDVEPDVRSDRGFVGVSILDPDSELNAFRFVGPRAEDSAAAGGGGRNVGGNTRGGGGFGRSINVSEGIFVERTNAVRTRLVPRFQAPNIAPGFVASRFNQRMRSLPATRGQNSLSVVMQGRTAVIRGTALNRDQVTSMARQLRLEPGVSRIVSQVSINP